MSQTIWATTKWISSLLANRRIGHRDLLKGLYAHVEPLVAQGAPEYVIMALDPVNFEKPYCQQVEGVSTVMKSTPPVYGWQEMLDPWLPGDDRHHREAV